MNYSNTATPVSPTDVSLREFTIATDTTLVWSYSGLDDANTAARIMIVTASAAGLSLLMPPANQGELGWSTVITNVGAETFSIKDNAGGVITTLTAGTTKIIELRTQATIAGTWLPVVLGATGSAADASLLAGYGLKAITTTLNSNVLGADFSANQSFNLNNRASFQNWTGGAGTATIALASSLGNGWWIGFRNSGSGALSIASTSPDLINAGATEVLNPNDSCFVFCTGTALYTVGLGRDVVIADSQLVKNVAGNSNVTLTATEYANNIIKFTGLLTGDIDVIFPTSIKNYFLSNITTGAFTLTAKTAAGTGIVILQNGASVVTVDGTNLNDATNGAGGGGGTVTSVTAGTGLTGGVITTTGTIALANTAVAAGTYGSASAGIPSVTVDGQGRITAASNSGAIYDSILRIQDNGDATKQVAFECSNITTGTTRTLTVPDSNVTLGTPLDGTVTTAKIVDSNVTTAKIADANVTLAKIANAGANSKLVGAGAAGAGAPYSEISLDSSLTMTGTTLSVTAGASVASVTATNSSLTISPTTGAVSAAINTNNSLGVGAYAYLYYNSSTPLTNGSTASGSNLFPLCFKYNATFTSGAFDLGSALSGTWRNVSGSTLQANGNANIGLFIRTV